MLKDKIYIISRKKIEDNRGWFIKPLDGNEPNLSLRIGEVYVTVAAPKQSKGGDYSLKTNKWFTLVKGNAILLLEDIETKERMSIQLESRYPKTIFVPCKIANIIQNNGEDDCILVVYADKQYDMNDIIPYKL